MLPLTCEAFADILATHARGKDLLFSPGLPAGRRSLSHPLPPGSPAEQEDRDPRKVLSLSRSGENRRGESAHEKERGRGQAPTVLPHLPDDQNLAQAAQDPQTMHACVTGGISAQGEDGDEGEEVAMPALVRGVEGDPVTRKAVDEARKAEGEEVEEVVMPALVRGVDHGHGYNQAEVLR